MISIIRFDSFNRDIALRHGLQSVFFMLVAVLLCWGFMIFVYFGGVYIANFGTEAPSSLGGLMLMLLVVSMPMPWIATLCAALLSLHLLRKRLPYEAPSSTASLLFSLTSTVPFALALIAVLLITRTTVGGALWMVSATLCIEFFVVTFGWIQRENLKESYASLFSAGSTNIRAGTAFLLIGIVCLFIVGMFLLREVNERKSEQERLNLVPYRAVEDT